MNELAGIRRGHLGQVFDWGVFGPAVKVVNDVGW